jgi:MFS family permease
LRAFRDLPFMFFTLASLLMALVYMNMNTTLGVYLRDAHSVPESGYGWILSLNAAMVVFFQFAITRRIEKFPPLLMVAIGTALYAVGFAMYGFISAFWLFLLAMAIITIGEMVSVPVTQALVAKFSPEDMRGRYMAVYGYSWGIASAVGPWAAGLIMDQGDPNWLWYACGIIGSVSALGFLYLHGRESGKTPRAPVPINPSPLDGGSP